MKSRRAWTKQDDRALRRLCARGLRAKEIGKAMGRDCRLIRVRAIRTGLDLARKFIRTKWSRAEIVALKAAYADTTTQEIARRLSRTLSSVYREARILGLKKSAAYLAGPAACRLRRRENGRHPGQQYWFPKGHVPANKGLRRPGWSAGRMTETQFKKGRPAQAAHNYRPIGSEKVDRKRGVLMRKVTDDPSIFPVKRWRPVHVLVWEAKHGSIPAGHICVFKRDAKTLVRSEITVDRLEVVSLAENMLRNTIHHLPKPLVQVIMLRGALNRKIRNRSRRLEEQNGRSA